MIFGDVIVVSTAIKIVKIMLKISFLTIYFVPSLIIPVSFSSSFFRNLSVTLVIIMSINSDEIV